MIVKPVIIDPLEAEWAEAFQSAKDAVTAADAEAEQVLANARERGELAEEVRELEAKLRTGRQFQLFDNLPRQKRVRELDTIRSQLREANRAVEAARNLVKQSRDEFLLKLREFRVLDPACGSGNFLYVALRALKDIEHRVNIDAETLGIERLAPQVGPECVLGIELNPYAAELARVSVWIGEIQWMRRNGFDAAKNPILRNLDTIECRDAVLDESTGDRAAWPQADVVIGNPPFLGGSKMLDELGEAYTRALRKAWSQVPGGSDLVCYWFASAWDRMVANQLKRGGFVSTNSIRGGANRSVLIPIAEHGRIFDSWSDEDWTVEGAAVRVSMVCFELKAHRSETKLNGKPVARTLADLTEYMGNFDLTKSVTLKENIGICHRGIETGGPFEMGTSDFQKLACMPVNPNGHNNSSVLKRILNGTNILKRSSPRFMIDFGPGTSEMDAALYEQPFEYLKNRYTEYRIASLNKKRKIEVRCDWWLHRRTGANLRKAIDNLPRYIVTPRVGKYRIFIWMDKSALPDSAAFAIARDDDTTFGILHSRLHELWSLRMGTFLGVGNDPRYTPSTTFETFPFPEGLTPNIPATDYADDPRAQSIAKAAARLNELRENWLNPPDLVVREPEVVPGYPDRILARDEAAAKELAKRTLTNLYNARPAWLDHAHHALDEAVADAYSWGDDFRTGTLTDDEILARLFQLNQERTKR